MDDETKMDRLLGGENSLSQPEKEELFEDVYAEVEPSESGEDREGETQKTAPSWTSYAAVAAAVLLVTMAAWAPLKDFLTQSDSQFRARGTSIATYETVCLDSNNQKSPCRIGDRLVFKVTAPGFSHFAAFAKSGDGPTIWYFPSEASKTSYSLTNSDKKVIDKGIELSTPHEPGTYKVWGIFSKEPLKRSEIRTSIQSDKTDNMKVVTKKFQIR
jgi:hypothetical protein